MRRTLETFIPDYDTRETVEVETGNLIKSITCVQEESQVTIHCTVYVRPFSKVRIWKSTFLYDTGSSYKSPLKHAHGISVFPAAWVSVGNSSAVHFTLIFNALPKSCSSFSLLETTHGDPGRFRALAIPRNKEDVYRVTLICG